MSYQLSEAQRQEILKWIDFQPTKDVPTRDGVFSFVQRIAESAHADGCRETVERAALVCENDTDDDNENPVLAARIRALAPSQVKEAPLRHPDVYAYKYADGYIRFTNGESVNGSGPVETIPCFFGIPQPSDAAEREIEKIKIQLEEHKIACQIYSVFRECPRTKLLDRRLTELRQASVRSTERKA